ncbi:post-segregation antitoxin (ccd killing protein) [Paraburkholderia terricola]|uniref:type II toxin-antitoxin system CcdA family antitoxin n=1 Tax=Paraburkholderia terricola TaxID=169427 RepID=UPI002857C5A3|nr:type II toxin-antitoxin system CcdA family antitoxin [Paraburkholderia terricola]MDR6450190.1 post-segregation antitoxin (ccd killing protein) [Paraburkholderia terricola]
MISHRSGSLANPTSQPARKSTNVSLPADLLDRAKRLDVNISRASERRLREEVHEAESLATLPAKA